MPKFGAEGKPEGRCEGLLLAWPPVSPSHPPLLYHTASSTPGLMLSYFRAACLRTGAQQARKAPPTTLVRKQLPFARTRAPLWKRTYCGTVAQASSDAHVAEVSQPFVKAAAKAPSAKFVEVLSELQNILGDVEPREVAAGPSQIEQAASDLLEKLTPSACALLRSRNTRKNKEVFEVLVQIGQVFLRCGRVEDLETLVLAVTSNETQISALFNHVWMNYARMDVNREDVIHGRAAAKKMFPEKVLAARKQANAIDSQETTPPRPHSRFHWHLSEYAIGGPGASLMTISISIQRAISLYNVAPTTQALCSIVLLTLRMVPADLKALRQEVVKKSRSEVDMERLREEASSSQPATHHDLTPSNTPEYLPSINSVYKDSAPILRRPIPIEKAHSIVRESLGPIWDLLKEQSGELNLTELATLLRAFNKATLVVPTLHLAAELAKFGSPDESKVNQLVEAYVYALRTLCDDIQYDHVYSIYKNALFDSKRNAMRPFVQNSGRLLTLVLRGVSRATKATRAEKEQIFALALPQLKPSSAEALTSYCYAMARDASVSPTELLDIFTQTSHIPFQKHNLQYLNEIFFGLSVRGAFHLAHKVLSDMWSRGAVITASSVSLYLDRCIASRQLDLIDDILALMRPTSPVVLRSDRGRSSSTTSQNLPVRLPVSQLHYRHLFELYAKVKDDKKLLQTLSDYQRIDNYVLDRTLFRDLLGRCARMGSPACAIQISKIFNDAGMKTGIQEANEILHAYNVARLAPEALDFWNSLPSLSLTPTEETYGQLVYSYGNSFQPEKALEVLELMQDAGVPITATIFEALLAVHAPISVEKSEWILQHMNNIKVTPSLRVYQPLLKVYAEQGNAAMFRQHLDLVTQTFGLKFDLSFCKMLVSAFSRLNDLKSITDWLLPLMAREQLPSDNPSFVGALVAAYYRLSQDKLAEEALTELPKQRRLHQTSHLAGAVFIPSLKYLASTSLTRAWNLIHLMETKYGVPVGPDMYAAVMEEVNMQNDEAKSEEARNWMRRHLHPIEFEALENTMRMQSEAQ